MAAISIISYQESWTADFKRAAADLHAVLGSTAVRVDHIGSTAVPALCAKDIIDVQVTVAALDGDIANRLLAAGFTIHTDVRRQDHLPPGFDAVPEDWAKLFFMQRPGWRRCNIHARQAGKPNQRYALLFRDFLRADPLTAEAYGKLKQSLASSLADANLYPDVKDAAVDVIYLAAQRWARQTNWQPSNDEPLI